MERLRCGVHVVQHCASETTDRVGTVGGATAEQSSPSLAPLSDNRRRLSHPVSTERFSFHRGDGEIGPRSHHSAILILLLASKLMQGAHTHTIKQIEMHTSQRVWNS